MASRAMLSLLVSIALLAGMAMVRPLPISAYGLAVIASFLGSMAILDKTPGSQIISRVVGCIVAVAAVLLSSVLAAKPTIAYLTFLVVIFAAVYIRKFGPRWFAAGMIAFMAYFMGDYLKPPASDIGWIALAVAIAFCITHLIQNFLLPDSPERNFRRALATIDRRINVILDELIDLTRRHPDSGRVRWPLQRQLEQLRDIVLMAEGFIPQGGKGSLAIAGAASELAMVVFELQLAMERMVRASYLALPSPGLLEAVLHRDGVRVSKQISTLGKGSSEEVASRLLLRVYHARERLNALLAQTPSPAFLPSPDDEMTTGVPAEEPAPAGSIVPLDLQRPIQVTVACAVAIGVGLLLSPVRWYWAVIAAFIVFNNTKSRADTAIKALQRSMGTLAGFLAGTVIATLLQGQMVISAIAVPTLFFIGFYFLQRSYSVMIFFITVALALLYGVMGMFTPELLLLRLEETLVGALAGAGAAFFIFPARASTGVTKALDAYFSALDALVATARDQANDRAAPGDLLSLSRTLDYSYTELANAVRPLGGPWNAVTRFGQIREKLLLLTGCAHWSRALARSLRSGKTLDTSTLDRINVLAEEIAGRIARAVEREKNFFERPHPGDGVTPIDPARPPLPITEEEDPAFSLEVISALLDRATPGPGPKPA